jgi:hypothetical protein
MDNVHLYYTRATPHLPQLDLQRATPWLMRYSTFLVVVNDKILDLHTHIVRYSTLTARQSCLVRLLRRGAVVAINEDDTQRVRELYATLKVGVRLSSSAITTKHYRTYKPVRRALAYECAVGQ